MATPITPTTPETLFQIRAQILGWKNKLHHVRAASLDDAHSKATTFFGVGWSFHITALETGEVMVDAGFDETWKET